MLLLLLLLAAATPKPCEPKALVDRQMTLSDPNYGGVIWTQVSVPLVDERCYAPKVEFTVTFDGPSVFGEPLYRESQESDAEPWQEKDEPPAIHKGEFVEGRKATPRAWSWHPGGNVHGRLGGRYAPAGTIGGLPDGVIRFRYKLTQGKWTKVADVVVHVQGMSDSMTKNESPR